MTTVFTIGQLARSAGVPTTTLRYYERRGLLRLSVSALVDGFVGGEVDGFPVSRSHAL